MVVEVGKQTAPYPYGPINQTVQAIEQLLLENADNVTDKVLESWGIRRQYAHRLMDTFRFFNLIDQANQVTSCLQRLKQQPNPRVAFQDILVEKYGQKLIGRMAASQKPTNEAVQQFLAEGVPLQKAIPAASLTSALYRWSEMEMVAPKPIRRVHEQKEEITAPPPITLIPGILLTPEDMLSGEELAELQAKVTRAWRKAQQEVNYTH